MPPFVRKGRASAFKLRQSLPERLKRGRFADIRETGPKLRHSAEGKFCMTSNAGLSAVSGLNRTTLSQSPAFQELRSSHSQKTGIFPTIWLRAIQGVC